MTFITHKVRSAVIRILRSYQCGLLLAITPATIAEPVFSLGPASPSPPLALGARTVSLKTEVNERPRSPGGLRLFDEIAVALRPSFAASYLYATGIQAQPGEGLSSAIKMLAGGVVIETGEHWTFGYTGTRTAYSNPAFKTTYDHLASLSGKASYDVWTVRAYQSYLTSSRPLIETGRQTPQKEHLTVLTAARSLGSDFLAELQFKQQLIFPGGFAGTREWPLRSWVYYQIAPGIKAGAGLTLGYVKVSPGPDMSYRRPQLRLEWGPSNTILFTLSAGRETRMFYSPSNPRLHRPVISSAVQLRPFRTTTFSFVYDRGVTTSNFSGEISEINQRGFQLQQRLLGHFFLKTGLERQRVSYLTGSRAMSTSQMRTDSRKILSAEIGTNLRQRGTLSTVYQWSKNRSNFDGYSYKSTQYGIEAGYRY